MARLNKKIRAHRTLVVIVSAVALLGAFLTTGAADAAVYSFRSKGVSAFGSWDYCTARSCSSVDLYAFQGSEKSSVEGSFRGTLVCLSIWHFEQLGATFSRPPPDETGCTVAPKKTLTVARDLSLATLAATTVEVRRCRYDFRRDEYICNPKNSRLITVAARWTGRGVAETQSSRYRFKTGDCTDIYSHRGTFRDARGRADFDGISAGRSWEAGLGKGMTRVRSTCPY